MRTRLHEARAPHPGCDSVWCVCVGMIAGAASKHQPGLVGAVLELFRELHATGGDTDSSAGGGIGAGATTPAPSPVPRVTHISLLSKPGMDGVVSQMFVQSHLQAWAKQCVYEQLLLLQALLLLLGPSSSTVSSGTCDAACLARIALLFHHQRFSVSTAQLVFLPSSPSIQAMTRKFQHLCVLVLVNAMQLPLVTTPAPSRAEVEAIGDALATTRTPHPVLSEVSSSLANVLGSTYVEAAKRWFRAKREPPPYVRRALLFPAAAALHRR